ncbi:type II secretion system F family protein [Lentibacillus sp. N15]|uniref:type II secretion system F family protein n=1 Tax=Lentibacillus songyuanensis TaxID=3136161 RepID=UPI0031BA9BCD
MNFQYRGKRMSGQKVNGRLDASSKQEALFQLEKKGLVIFSIDETKPWNKDLFVNRKIKNKVFVIFLRQYATLIHAGISISDATKTMLEQTRNDALKQALQDIDQQLNQGVALSETMDRHPKVFPALLLHMVQAGEASGKLDEILKDMADYYEKEYRNKQKIISTLLYPGIVSVITLFLSIFLLIFIVPRFVGMFRSFGQDIPAYTQFILNLSGWVGSFWWVLIVIVALCVLLYRYCYRYEAFCYRMDGLKLKFPVLGMLVHKGALVRMTQTLSTLVNSSVPILQSVAITEKVVGNRVIERVLRQVRESIRAGESMAMPMKVHWAFPTLIVQMVQIGEKTGSLDYMLAKASTFYEAEVEQISGRIKTLIEPIMIIILTVIVGGIILAIVIPMFSLFEGIQ